HLGDKKEFIRTQQDLRQLLPGSQLRRSRAAEICRGVPVGFLARLRSLVTYRDTDDLDRPQELVRVEGLADVDQEVDRLTGGDLERFDVQLDGLLVSLSRCVDGRVFRRAEDEG